MLGSLDSQVNPWKATKQFAHLVTLQSYLPFPGYWKGTAGTSHAHFLLHEICVADSKDSLGETWECGLGLDTGLLFGSSGQPGTKGIAVNHQSPGAPVPSAAFSAASLGPQVSVLGMEPRESLFNELPQQSFWQGPCGLRIEASVRQSWRVLWAKTQAVCLGQLTYCSWRSVLPYIMEIPYPCVVGRRNSGQIKTLAFFFFLSPHRMWTYNSASTRSFVRRIKVRGQRPHEDEHTPVRMWLNLVLGTRDIFFT